jgi:hypothetical protein
MGQNNFLINLMKNADNLLQSTLKESLDNNSEYQQLAETEDIAESAFIKMSSSLTKDQKDIIENWIEKRDLLNAEYSTMAYIQGYIDCIRLLNVLQPNIFGDS